MCSENSLKEAPSGSVRSKSVDAAALLAGVFSVSLIPWALLMSQARLVGESALASASSSEI